MPSKILCVNVLPTLRSHWSYALASASTVATTHVLHVVCRLEPPFSRPATAYQPPCAAGDPTVSADAEPARIFSAQCAV